MNFNCKIKSLSSLMAIVILSSFSISMPAFADKKPVSVQIYEKSQQMAFYDEGYTWGYSKDEYFSKVEKENTPNKISHVKTLKADEISNISRISIEANRIGVLVEPSDTGDFKLDFIGVQDNSNIKADISAVDGKLTMTAVGGENIDYVCLDETKRVNTVRLSVPDKKYDLLEINCDTAFVLSPDLGAANTGSCGRGVITLSNTEISSDSTFGTSNGTIKIQGEKISGKVNLSAENGTVKVVGGNVTGEVELSAQNGTVYIEADTLTTANMTTRNGKVDLDIGTIEGKVTTKSDNGNINVIFQKQPVDLAFNLDANSNANIVLPTGWEKTEKFGSAKPILNVFCKNGSIDVQIGEPKEKKSQEYYIG